MKRILWWFEGEESGTGKREETGTNPAVEEGGEEGEQEWIARLWTIS